MKIELEIEDIRKIVSEMMPEVIRGLNPTLAKSSIADSEIFDVQGLAAYLKTKPKWIYSHMHLLPHFKLDGLLRFRKADIDRLIGRQSLKTSSKQP